MNLKKVTISLLILIAIIVASINAVVKVKKMDKQIAAHEAYMSGEPTASAATTSICTNDSCGMRTLTPEQQQLRTQKRQIELQEEQFKKQQRQLAEMQEMLLNMQQARPAPSSENTEVNTNN